MIKHKTESSWHLKKVCRFRIEIESIAIHPGKMYHKVNSAMHFHVADGRSRAAYHLCSCGVREHVHGWWWHGAIVSQVQCENNRLITNGQTGHDMALMMWINLPVAEQYWCLYCYHFSYANYVYIDGYLHMSHRLAITYRMLRLYVRTTGLYHHQLRTSRSLVSTSRMSVIHSRHTCWSRRANHSVRCIVAVGSPIFFFFFCIKPTANFYNL